MRYVLLILFAGVLFCRAGDAQLVTYLNTRYPLQSPLKAWGVTANQIAWAENIQMMYISREHELNREINLWNDSPALAGLYAKEFISSEEKGRGQTSPISAFSGSDSPPRKLLLMPGNGPHSLLTSKPKTPSSAKKVSRIRFPELMIPAKE